MGLLCASVSSQLPFSDNILVGLNQPGGSIHTMKFSNAPNQSFYLEELVAKDL